MDLLLRVYGSTREEEIAMVVDWTDEQKDAFVRSQFEAQHAWYQDHYQGARSTSSWSTGCRPGGSTSIAGDREIRLVDITLLPEFRAGRDRERPCCATCWRRGRRRASR